MAKRQFFLAATVILSAALAVAGCTLPKRNAVLASLSADKIQASDDPFQPFLEYDTPAEKLFSGPYGIALFLSGRKDRKSAKITVIVKVSVVYTAMQGAKFNSARDRRARALHVTKVSRHIRCRGNKDCVLDEYFDVTIPVDYLQQAGADGYHIKCFAKAGSPLQLTIPKQTIDALFARLKA